MTTRQVPVTLITGFLGAGKTTLINRVLRQADGLRLAVLVNDFGAVNIDAELIEGAAEEIISLKNGCICCSLTGGLLAAVSSVLRRPDPPDAIVVEGSGVTDPLEVARALSDPELQRYAPLDGIVTVVDAAGLANLDGEALELAQRQIATADLVLLNKADLADRSMLQAAEAHLMALAPGIRIIRCTDAEVPLSVVLGPAGSNAGAGFKCEAVDMSTALAQEAFESIVIERSDPIEVQRLHDLLSRLPERVYRVKGILHLAERPQTRCILQAAGRRASITVGRPWADEPPGSRIVFIAAKGALDRSLIERWLDGASMMKPRRDALVA
ncbi:GTP-binding protein [Mesorhizobium sp. VK25A]|uniref:GTP-binding protein n=1 Tax=Mesorhizobium vachelliae TaxID=3072309 RepID=A0ABU4ZZH6_9HYPH|nr:MULTISPECIES: GTP-binding protein [unclassified Mesorhizobium]MDX8530821.1 GTP-binding protein [Mesorhizobium sp. VK25D]MDX8543428.1 GTP-binding protein [Mesorhizobium sp. VK25A]